MTAKAVLVLALLVAVAESFSNFPNARGNINTLLTCGRTVLVLSLQPRGAADVWLPAQNKRFTREFSGIELIRRDDAILYGHLGDDYDSNLVSIDRPVEIPNFMSVSFGAEIGMGLFSDARYNQSQMSLIREWASSTLFCSLTAEWTDLGPNYWPRWYAGRKCTEPSTGCSLARNNTCYPDISTITEFATVLNFDCCYQTDNTLQSPYVYTCGWRKVRVPLVSRCSCGCGPILP